MPILIALHIINSAKMPARKLGLFDLLAPQYLAGIQLPQQVQNYLAVLGIDEFNSFYDDHFIVYSGTASFEGDGSGSAEVVHEDPSGARFTWERKNIQFRMIVPRDGAEFVDRAANSSSDGKLPAVAALLNDLRPQPDSDMDVLAAPVVDFPAVSFRLELLVDILNFSLGAEWKPGIINPADNRVKIDPAHASERVVISLPKVLISYAQGDDANNLNPTFKIESWGVAGFDAQQDLAMGEVIRMHPPIAVHQSEHVAFSIDRVVIDASKDATPPEILEHFGVDEAWEGIFIGQALFYFSNDQGVGFNIRLKDALISFSGEVSLEAALDIYLNSTLGVITATPVFYNGATQAGNFIRGVIDQPAVDAIPTSDPRGSITVQQGAVMHLQVNGGMPPYTIRVMKDGTNIWNAGSRTASFPDAGAFKVFVAVRDSSTGAGGALLSSEYILVTVQAAVAAGPQNGTAADNPPATEPLQPINPFNKAGNDAEHDVTITQQGQTINLEIRGPEPFSVNVTGGTTPLTFSNQRTVQLDVPNNTNLALSVNFPLQTAGVLPDKPELVFSFARPSGTTDAASYVGPPVTTNDSIFLSSFQSFEANRPAAAGIGGIQLDGWASNDPSNPSADVELSARRNSVVQQKLAALYPGVTINPIAHGHSSLPYSTEPFDPHNPNHSNDENRLVRISFTSASRPAVNITATISRPAFVPGPPPPAVVPPGPPAAPALPNDIPPVLKQLGIRVKIERNKLSLLELYGKVDFETELEKKLRNEPSSEPTGDLALQHGNAHDGEIDFKVTYQYDQATNETTLIFLLHSDERDTDGLLHMDNNANRDDRFKNIFGALLLFAPVINSAATAVGNNTDDPGAWIALGVSLAVPVAIGGLNIFRTRKVILYGGEARTRFVTPAPGEPLRSLDIGLVFDYEVQFDIIVEQLGIGKNRLPGAPTPLPPPLRARYKAIGFNLNYSDTPAYKGLTYTPVFDASRGYDLDLSDPSLFQLPAPLGNLFNIVGARLARFNPVTLEVDFAIKVDLGVITVDRFKLKIPLDPIGAPQIIPSGVRVNIPGVLVGNGFVEIIDTDITNDDGSTTHAKGIEGGLDLTLVSLKIRILANMGVGTLKDNTTQREAISVFLGMIVQFPTPIILGATGLGIYGFMGLFAMHYKRLEAPADPTKAVGPALNWLIKASGEPPRMRTKSSVEEAMAPAGNKLWGMAFDRWSFGIGVLMGTAEGGFLVNMQGMLVLELPGPRILIMVKVKIVSVLPSQPPDPAKNLEVGIIGIIDIDFNRQQLTLGVMLNFSIEQVLAITLPIELFFKWNDPSNWHLYLGTIAQPASATILDIVRGSAYLMLQGNQLKYADYGTRVPEFMRDKVLNGIAIAIGLEASIILGDEGAGVYLKIAAGAHLGVSFSPFMVVGNMYFTGKLRLVILSIGARGSFDILVTKVKNSNDLKVYMHGEVCGSIDLFFFEISACIGITIGDEDYDVEAPKLVRGVYLQSFSPVLTSGQGSTKPIDSSLGNAHDLSTGPVPSTVVTVPIDSLPVIQLHASPTLDSNFAANSFVLSPGVLSGTGGVLKLSDEVQVTYKLNSVKLKENGADYNSGSTKPPSVWRIDRPNNGSPTDTSVDLATFSRTPATAPHAIERSTELNKNVEVRWENACKQAAPAAPVLYTFCGQAIGLSSSGWVLIGTPKPDPVGTVRTEPVNRIMKIYEPNASSRFSSFDMVLGAAGYGRCNAAKIVGIENLNVNIPPTRQHKCFSFRQEKAGYKKNPLIVEEELKIFSAEDKRSFFVRNAFIPHTQLDPYESPYRTHYRAIKKTIGLSLREYMRIDLLKEPVDAVSISFTCFNTKAKERPRLIIYAYDTQSKKLDQQIFVDSSRREQIHTITLKGDQIKHILIYNRNFTGQILEICYDRVKNTNLQAFAEMLRCFRSLQMPYCTRDDDKQKRQWRELMKEQELKAYFDKADSCCYTIFDSGACESALFYGALHKKTTRPVYVEELSSSNQVLAQYKLADLVIKNVINPNTDFPADWLAVPWRQQILPVGTYLQSGFYNEYNRILFELKPKNKNATRVRICTCNKELGIPVLYISAIETLQLSEVQHEAHVTEMLTTEQETLSGYLNDNTPVPLLKPNKTYNVVIDYTVTIETRKKPTDAFTVKSTANETQTFAFKTDNKAPLPLSPYVLGTIPVMDDQFHFFEDPLKVVFNDNAFIKMYQAYGKQLKAIIRGADGLPMVQSPEIINTTEAIPASVKTPYREAIEALIAAGKLPCIGVMNFPTHAVYNPPFILKPLMPYTFDIDVEPKDPVALNSAEQPLFRRAFKTSRYANLEELVKELSTQALRHKALKANFAGLPAAVPGPEPSVHTLTDIDLETALTNAGFAPDDAKEKTGITLCWANNSGDFSPYALLIDASEPLWRSRMESVKKPVLNEQMNEIDPAFKIYENTLVDAMVLRKKSGQAIIKQFIRSTAGTKTLILFNSISWPESGTTFTVMIEQTASSFYALPVKSLTLTELQLFPKAPWED
ncbi:MAG: hypothetical protein JWQ27_3116 [Ferruginibacter sp.]|nr:hypothetical protein [Ferruginibacter sp.]